MRCIMEEKKVLLSVKDLVVKFRVRGRILTAIRGVSLDIKEDECIAIVGESGSGKSVFTKTFAGMLDSNGFIDQGDIIFDDDELADTHVQKSSYVMNKASERCGDLAGNAGAQEGKRGETDASGRRKGKNGSGDQGTCFPTD